MPARPWSRFALALLLLWQLNAAVAFAAPHGADAAGPAGAPATHCTSHTHPGAEQAGPTSGGPGAPAAPDCCHDAAAACHCVQIPGLALPALAPGVVLPPDPPPVLRVAPRLQARGTEFFRPPI